jgi:branched-chain amino acid transport system substrate-binding protein
MVPARVLSCALSLLLSLGPQSAASPALLDKGAIRIGLLTPVTGPFAATGAEVNGGFEYYLATHGGRLGGFRAELKGADEGNSIGTALADTRDLIEQAGVDAIVGVVNSGVAYGLSPYLAARHEPMILAVAGADELTQGQASPNVFRVADTNSQDSMPLGDYACRRSGARSVAMIGMDYAFGWEKAGGFARAFTDAGCRIVQEVYVPPDTSDWTPYVRSLGRGAAAVYAAVNTPNAVRFLAAYRRSGPRLPLMAWGGMTDESLLAAEGATADGVVSGLHYTPSLTNASNRRFVSGYESLTGHAVSHLVENGYVAAAMLSQALERIPAGEVSSVALTAALRGLRLDAPRGQVCLDRFRQVQDDVYIQRVKMVGGKPHNELVATYRSVSQFWRYPAARYLTLPTYAQLKGTWVRTWGAEGTARFRAGRRRA